MRHFPWILLVLVGCTPKPDLNPSPADAFPAGGGGDRCRNGVVGVIGSEGSREVVLRLGEGRTVVLRGGEPLRVIRLLTGGEVEVCGDEGEASGYGPTFRISTVRLLRMDGMEAWLGVLSGEEGGWVLGPVDGQQQDAVPLGSVPDDLAVAVTHHVWVAGDWSDGVFVVRSFGVLPALDGGDPPGDDPCP